jgi:hypothetical protein
VVTESSRGVPEELIPVPTYTGLKKKKTVGTVPAEIEIDHFPDTNYKRYSLNKPTQQPNGDGNKVLIWNVTCM